MNLRETLKKFGRKVRNSFPPGGWDGGGSRMQRFKRDTLPVIFWGQQTLSEFVDCVEGVRAKGEMMGGIIHAELQARW